MGNSTVADPTPLDDRGRREGSAEGLTPESSTPRAPAAHGGGQPPKRLGTEVLDLRTVDAALTARNLAAMAGAFAVAGGAMAVAWKRPRPAVLAAAYLVVSSRQQAILNMEHDCTHRTFVKGRRWNERVGSVLLGAPVGSPFYASSARHLAHHRLVGTPDDPDLDLHNGAGDGTRLGLVKHFAGGLSGAYAAKLFLRRSSSGDDGPAAVPASASPGPGTPGSSAAASDTADPGAADPDAADRGDARRDLLALGGVQTVLLAGTTFATSWWVYPVLWLGPLATLTAGAHLLRSFVEHAVLDEERPEHDNLLISTESNPLERQLVAPFNMNHHAEHHLFPWIPASRLPEARRRIDASGAKPAILRRRSYLGALRRHLWARAGSAGR